MNDNNLQNIAEIAKFITDLFVHKKVSIPTRLSDAWLAYRYTYQTGKSDIEDAIDFMKREKGIEALGASHLQTYGVSHTSYEGVDVTCRCTLKLMHKELDSLKNVWYALYKYGLAPDAYVIWDSIPFSFIVDWFIPIGDIAKVSDTSVVYDRDTFDIQDVVFSLSYDVMDEVSKTSVHCYSRWRSTPLRLNGMYWFDKDRSASRETWTARALDAASLIIGRR
jgi:hypothetical protein